MPNKETILGLCKVAKLFKRKVRFILATGSFYHDSKAEETQIPTLHLITPKGLQAEQQIEDYFMSPKKATDAALSHRFDLS